MRRLHINSLLFALAISACSPVTDSGLPPEAVVLTTEPTVLLRSSYTGIPDRRRLVITSTAAWEQFWVQAVANRSPQPPVPAVDFSGNVVIVAAMGTRGSGGYSIDVDALYEANDKVYAVVLETSPGRCMVTLALTAPVIAVQVPRPGADVVFVDRTATYNCE